MNKNNIIIYICIAIFGIVGVYLTFFASNTSKFDSETKAYRIAPNEKYDSDDGYTYEPVFYFKVDGRDYECKSNGSSSYPSESKNTVYYDSHNPSNCKTEYDKSSSKFAGIICLIATAAIVFFFIIKKPSNNEEINEIDKTSIDSQLEQEHVEKIFGVVGKVQLIYKRVIIGIIILVLLVLILIETAIVKQTIVSKDYPEVVAVLSNKKSDEESTVFDDYVYTFTDKSGNNQEIVVSVSKNEEPKQEMKIKYNENNPQDYYEESATFDKSGIIWYIVKIVAMILLIMLFFNKRLLSKINIR